MHRCAMAVILILSNTVVWSAEHEDPFFGQSKRGWYLGGGYASTRIGYYETYDIDYGYIFGDTEYGSSDSGFIVNGGYRFNRWLAIEVGYLDGGEPTFDDNVYSYLFQGDTEIDIAQETTAVQLSVLGILPLGKKWEIYVKGGGSFWDATSQQAIVLPNEQIQFREIEKDGFGLLLGAGVGFSPWKNLHLRVEYQTFDTDKELVAGDLIEKNDVDVDGVFDALTLEAHWRFGDEW